LKLLLAERKRVALGIAAFRKKEKKALSSHNVLPAPSPPWSKGRMNKGVTTRHLEVTREDLEKNSAL
jgi:hypothetical protein